MTRYAHTCEDGHTWVEQEDGGVSPSWGYGLTSVRFEQGPRACPEPARDSEGRYECAGCGGRFYGGHGTPGVMSDPWNHDPRCTPPEPVCGKAPVRTERWVEGSGRGKTRTFGGWRPVSPDVLTNATAKGMIVSEGNPDPEEDPMTEDGATVTLMAKPDAKTPWHFQVTEGSGRAVCGTVVNPTTGARLVERDCDPRTVRMQGRPVCSNCAAKFNNGNTTTEEVTMSTTAASASTEAKQDPKDKQAAGRSSARTGIATSSGPGRSNATAATPAKATTTASKAKTEIDDGLDKVLIAQVKKALTKPELASPPSGTYTIIRSDGYKIGGYRPLSRKGLCVMLPAAVSAVKQAVKGADVEKFEKNVYRSRVYLTKAEQVPAVVKLLVAAAKEAVAADK